MKIILLTLLVLYALAMLGASLYSRRPGLAWLTVLNVFCALSLIAASLATCLGLASPRPGLFGAWFGASQPDDSAPCSTAIHLLGRIQASHVLIRGVLSLILWRACWFS